MHKPIATKEELLALMFKLMDEADAVVWPSDTPYSFIQQMAAWLEKEGSNANQPSWDLFARMLEAGRGDEGLD
ncbi:hypothetical protein [Haloferula sp. BvORR071]|uniref:hypothetical protein n=1 Tax=Haloferula sp. BvORR071 TaxID=1396141 RepID=UPI002240FC2F|nr:hypothetical protein [Haloferula sp. BvORR071]